MPAGIAATPEGNGNEGTTIKDRMLSLLDVDEPEEETTPAGKSGKSDDSADDVVEDSLLDEEEGVVVAEEGTEEEDVPGTDEGVAEEEPPKPASEPKTFTVLVDGKEVVVQEEERGRGYLRQQDYTRKTTEVAEQRKAVEAQRAEAEAAKADYAKTVTELRAYLDAAMKKEPTPEEWARLEQEDPVEFAVQKLKVREVRDQRDAVVAEEKRLAEEHREKLVAQVQDHLKAQEALLLEKLPAWKNADVASKEKKALQRFLTVRGFTPQEIEQLGDHRLLLVVRDAALYERVRAKGKEKLIPVPKGTVMKPGGGQSADPQEKRRRTVTERAKRTGSTRDAAERLLVSGLLDDT